MKYKHIIWDFDGTLFDTYPVMAESFSTVLHKFGINEPVERIEALMKISMGHAIDCYKKQYPIDETFLEEYVTLSAARQEESVKPFDEVVDICYGVCNNGGCNYLCTHRGESSFYFLKKFNLEKCFTEMVTSKNKFARKPSPDSILYLLQKYKIQPDGAVMIGDRDLDMLSAENAGIHTCFFVNGAHVYESANFIIKDFKELYTILDITVK